MARINTKILSFGDVQKSLQEIEKELNLLSESVNSPAETNIEDSQGKTGDVKIVKNPDKTYTFKVRSAEGWQSPIFDHDSMTNFVANEHIDWTTDQGSTNIHTGNYVAGGTSEFTLTADSGSNQTISNTNTLTIEGGEGIDTIVGATDKVTISGEDASTSNKGIAIFSSNNFAVSSGTVTIKDEGVALAELAHIATDSFLGRTTSSTGAVEVLSQSDALAILGVEAGATADQTQSDINGLAITTVGTIDTGTWEGTTIAVDQGGTGATNSNAWLNSRITTNADGSLNYDGTGATAVNHNSLTGYDADEHIDWTASSAGTIHSSNYSNTMGSGFTVSATTDSNATTITQGDDLMFAAGTGITCETTADGTVTISSTVTDTNTTYTGGTNLTLSGTTFNVDDAFLINSGDDSTSGTLTADGFNSGGTWTFAGAAGGDVAIQEIHSGTSFSDDDTSLMTAGAIKEKIENYNYSTTTGTVTSVGTTGTVNGITLTGTVTSSGNLTLGGTLSINNGDWSGTDLSVANGGTGASSLTDNSILTGTGTSAITAESNLTFDGTNLSIAATGKIYLDGGTDSYIHESSADVLQIYAGGDKIVEMTEATTGNKTDFGTTGVGFTQFEPTYNASDTNVNFNDYGNKAFVTFGAGNITDMNLYFPDVSCNCTLLLKQDGSGSRTVTNWKTFDQADGNESTVVWAGGSAPTLTTTANKLDIISFYWDNDNHKAYGVASLNF